VIVTCDVAVDTDRACATPIQLVIRAVFRMTFCRLAFLQKLLDLITTPPPHTCLVPREALVSHHEVDHNFGGDAPMTA